MGVGAKQLQGEEEAITSSAVSNAAPANRAESPLPLEPLTQKEDGQGQDTKELPDSGQAGK